MSHTPLSSGSNTLTTKSNQYRRFNSRAEFDVWIAERGKKNLAGLKAVGGSIIDFNHYIPDKRSLTMFDCTQHITGRLYPSPASPDLFILDFIDHNGKRVDVTKLIIYDTGDYGDDTRSVMATQGSLPDCRGTVDLYTLNPSRMVEIVTEDDVLLRRISFIYINGSSKPIIE